MDAEDSKKEVTLRVTDSELQSLTRTRRRRRGVPRADLLEPVIKKQEEKATTVAPVPVVPVAPVAPVAPSTAAMPANPNVKAPRIIYTKKRHVHVAPKPAVVIPTKTSFTPKELRVPMAKKNVVSIPSAMRPLPAKTRKFKAKRLSLTINSKRLTSERLTAARVAKMPLAEVKQELTAAGLLKGKSKSPEPVLRGMLTNWILLHAGA